MAIETANVVQALAGVGDVGGVPAYKYQAGFSGVVVFLPVAKFILTLDQPISADEANILVAGRGGFLASAILVNETTIEVSTQGGAGPAPGAFDIAILRRPNGVGPETSPNPDPIAPPFGGGSGQGFLPPVFLVNPGNGGLSYPSIEAAIAAAQLAGYGGFPTPAIGRATVLVVPADYASTVPVLDLVAGIDVICLNWVRSFTTRFFGNAGGSAVRWQPPPGGNPDTCFVEWSGIDIIPAPGLIGLELSGTEAGKIYLSECSIEGAGPPLVLANIFGGPGRSNVRGRNVTFRSLGAFACIEAIPGANMDVELVDTFIRRDSSFNDVAIEMDGPTNLRISRAEIDGRVRNLAGSVSLALAQVRTFAVPVVNCDNPAFGSTILGNVVLISGANPVVDGAGGFVWALVSTPPVAGDPFALTLNGGLGPIAGRLPVGYAAVVPAFWGPPGPPQDINVAIDRLTAGLFGLIGPIP